MFGKLNAKRRKNSTPNLFFAVVDSGRQVHSDLLSCLTLRNIGLKKGEKEKKGEKTSEECRLVKNALQEEGIPSPIIPRKLAGNKKDVRPEIHIQGTSLSLRNVAQEADDNSFRPPCVQPAQEEQAEILSKDGRQAYDREIITMQRILTSTPGSISTTSDCASQEVIDEHVLGFAEAQCSLNPSPWKEVWSVLQGDKGLANYPLSTKSVEFVRDVTRSQFSTRTDPYSKLRREKPQRIPPLSNRRKAVPTTHGRAKIPSFKTAVTFKGALDSAVANDIGQCQECVQLAELKGRSSQREKSFVHTCGKQEIEGKTERTIGLPYMTPSDRYKSKFRVKLLPLVTKSDSLPNLTSTTSSVLSELIVSAPFNAVARSSENIFLSCSKSEGKGSDFVKETELMNKRTKNSLDSVFSIKSFASCREREIVLADRETNVQEMSRN